MNLEDYDDFRENQWWFKELEVLNKGTDNQKRAHAVVRNLIRQQTSLLELLAVIHRDGGHYQDEYGSRKATLDAKSVVIADRQRLEELQAEAAAMREQKPVAYGDPKAFKNLRIDGHKGAPYNREWMWAKPDAGLVPLYAAPVSDSPVAAEVVQVPGIPRELHLRTINMLQSYATTLAGIDFPDNDEGDYRQRLNESERSRISRTAVELRALLATSQGEA